MDVNGNVIRFRLGAGANGTNGGSLGIRANTDSVTTMTFKVKITEDCQIFRCRDSVLNKAYANFVGLTSGQGRSTLSSASGLDPFGCPIQGATILRVVVPPCTPVADTTLSVYCEPYALSAITASRPGYTSFYNSSWVSITNATANGIYYAIKEFYPSCTDTISINFSSTGNCTLLPIILKDISATYNQQAGVIQWVTSSEINTAKFIVERSANGTNFIAIGQVQATGNSNTPKQYQFTDNNLPASNKIYYRLRIIDLDGSEKISKIVFIYTKKAMLDAEILQVIPNPLTDKSVIKILSKVNSKFEYGLYNINGQKQYSNTAVLKEGVNDIILYKEQLSKGIYIFRINKTNSFEVLTKTIVIQ